MSTLIKSLLVVLLTASCAGLITTSGLVTLNIHHQVKWQFPIVDSQTISTKTLNFLTQAKQYDIRMPSVLGGLDSVRPVIQVLQDASSSDQIIFHIAGYGGDVDAYLDLVNNIRATKATVTMMVEGPAYSAYAYLATSGSKLIMVGKSLLMFHTTSAYGIDCSKQTGLDRTRPVSEKCQKNIDAQLALFDSVIWDNKYLTMMEKSMIMFGDDVYISSEEMQRRIRNLH